MLTTLHILLSIAAVGILFIAAIQAVFLAVLNEALHKKYNNALTQSLPPLQRMETWLFQLIAVGFCVLTAVVISGFSFYPGIIHMNISHHLIFAILAWLVFGILMMGRVLFGWRGRKAIRWTLLGVILLLITFIRSF